MINKILNSKPVLFFLKKFTDINSIHISTIRNRYTKEEIIKEQVALIIDNYNILLDKTNSPKTIDFRFYNDFKNNKSYIIFTHEDINNGKTSRH